VSPVVRRSLASWLLEFILQRAGYEVLSATSADEAAELLEDHLDVQLLVTDINLPGSRNRARPDRRRTTTSDSPSSKGAPQATDTPTQQDTHPNLMGASRESTAMEHPWFPVISGRSGNAYLPKPADRPPADKFREPVDGTLIESERNWGHRALAPPVTLDDCRFKGLRPQLRYPYERPKTCRDDVGNVSHN
jgi:CheY-like chemotaxis protein